MINDSGIKTFTAAGTIYQKRRVKLTSTATGNPKVKLSGATGHDIGVAKVDAATGDLVAVDLLTKPGTLEIYSATTCAYGGYLKRGASGKATTTATEANAVFIAMEAASATGEIVEVMIETCL